MVFVARFSKRCSPLCCFSGFITTFFINGCDVCWSGSGYLGLSFGDVKSRRATAYPSWRWLWGVAGSGHVVTKKTDKVGATIIIDRPFEFIAGLAYLSGDSLMFFIPMLAGLYLPD